MLGVRIEAQLEQRLAALAKRTQRSKSYHAIKALEYYIAQEEAREMINSETQARWQEYQQTGQVIDNNTVMKWLDEWGEDQEAPYPEP